MDTMASEHPQEFPLGCEDLDAMIFAVCNIDLSRAVTSYSSRLDKLSLAGAFFSYDGVEAEVRVQNLNAVIDVSYINFSIFWINCNAFGVEELPLPQLPTALIS